MALMDNRSSSIQDDSSKQSIQQAKLVGEKLSAGVSKAVSHHNNSILRTNEKAANSQLHISDSHNVLNERKNYHSSALKVDGQYRGNERRVAKFMDGERKIEKNSQKIDKIERKLNKTMKSRYYRDFSIKGGITSPLRIEASMKSKLRPTSLQKIAGKAGNMTKSAIGSTSSALDTDEFGIQKAWVDATGKTAGITASVYKVSKAAKYWRAMSKERQAAKLLRKETKLMKSTFRTEYREAFNLFKNSSVGQSANFFEKQKYKKFLKKKYMKNAMKQYQQAKKAGNAARVVFSTGFSIKDRITKAGQATVDALKKLLAKKSTWIVLLMVACLILIPSIFSAFLTLLTSLFGGTGADEQQKTFPEQVEAYRPLIVELCEEYNTEPDKLNLPDYVNAMLAIIQIESNGSGTDPMQASECGYNTKYPQEPNAIQDAEYSCRCGVQYARDAFIKFGVEGADDFDRLAAAVQGYNFGINGWYNWISKRGGKYSVELAQEYSDTQMPDGMKGTPTHGKKFLDAYQAGMASAGGGGIVQQKGVEGVVMTALNQEGITENPSGSNSVVFNTDFYGSKVSGDAYPWCCAFVWWCFDKSGNGGIVPKTAGCSYMESHIGEYGGKKLSDKYKAQKGDLVIFRGGSHIGIVVENKGNGNLITIEGNTTPEGGTGSDYNGGCVAKRNRNIVGSNITAVLRPNYPED